MYILTIYGQIRTNLQRGCTYLPYKDKYVPICNDDVRIYHIRTNTYQFATSTYVLTKINTSQFTTNTYLLVLTAFRYPNISDYHIWTNTYQFAASTYILTKINTSQFTTNMYLLVLTAF